MRSFPLCAIFALAIGFLVAQDAVRADDTTAAKKDGPDAAVSGTTTTATAKPATTAAAKPTVAPHTILLKDAKPIPGVIPMYHKGSKLYAEISPAHFNQEYIILISIARGIGARPLLGGMTWGFGDDWVWTFRKIDDKIHIVRRNVRFRAKKGSPAAFAVKHAYTDSVLFSLSAKIKGPKGGYLVDLTPVFMSDLPQISQVLPGFVFSSSKSTFSAVKGYKDNMELQIAATYASSGRSEIDTVADSRGVTVNVHYSISKLPTTGYTPRMADDRVGYFLTVVKDYSKKTDRDRFVRYINRWNLQKADPSAPLSPPKKPIIFWLENTVPFKYRATIREGILEWNKAYEKAGFVNAIEVRQQPDNAEWDPEDINYNTFRWITSSAGFAMGPSRVNPRTGQILDADIIFDADFLSYWKGEFDTLSPDTVAALTGGPLDLQEYAKQEALKRSRRQLHGHDCQLNHGMAHQFALGTAAIGALMADAKEGDKTDAEKKKEIEKQKEKMILQGLKEVVMHEVGHTLGLRHNFKASTMLSLKDINDPEKAKNGTVSSVMDYTATNIVPKGERQGDYFTQTVGSYDMWAIEYGYKTLSGGTAGEVASLQKIAARSGEPGLDYAPDEEVRGIDPDPRANRFDLGKDVIAYAKQQSKLVTQLYPGLVDRMTDEGDDYTKARRTFNILVATHGQAMSFAARVVGGIHTSRSHKGDKDGAPPFTPIDPKRQRDALKLLEDQVLSDKPFQFPPELYNHLGATKWWHWGTTVSTRVDFPTHDFVLMWQDRILSQLMSSLTLERIHDTELKVAANKDAFTTAELIERLTKAIYSEVDTVKGGDYTNRKPAISSLRRNLQRSYLKRLSVLAIGNSFAPEDCKTIAYAELGSLQGRIESLLKNNKVKLDSYSRAHLQESARRIEKVLDAEFTLSRP